MCLGLVDVVAAQSDQQLVGLGWGEAGHTVGSSEDMEGCEETAATEMFLSNIQGCHVGVGVGSHHHATNNVGGGQDWRGWGDWRDQQGTTGVVRVRVRPHTTALVTTT